MQVAANAFQLLHNAYVEPFYLLKTYNQRGTAVEETLKLETRNLHRIAEQTHTHTRTHTLFLSLSASLSVCCL
ncbi:hypothetical protein L2E82_27525 [Cichorium intybus]|uniref:Uncharacterized protein n=1 Tax=Cichorium intybus TaxID=13427 RepID=A0ACB9CTC6_CICIN|nr:hypothetical protein L2E82_27525 [Cichorium intybus]